MHVILKLVLILVFLWLHLVPHTAGRTILLPKIIEFKFDTLQDIVIETMLGRESSVYGPLLLKLLFVGLKTMSLSVTVNIIIFIVSPPKFP